MFAVPDDWDEEDGAEVRVKVSNNKDVNVHLLHQEIVPKESSKKKKGHFFVNKLTRKVDAVVNSPGMTKGLLQDEEEKNDNEEEDRDRGTDRKKPKKTSSTSSLMESSVGSLLRKGIKFANMKEFCSFMDDKKSKKKKRKRTEEEEEASLIPVKKAKFDPDRLREVLGRGEAASGSSSTPSKAKRQLESSRFRYLNEQLYSQSGSQSLKMFRGDREAFRVYHGGYMEQAAKWPADPLHIIVTAIMKRYRVPQTVCKGFCSV